MADHAANPHGTSTSAEPLRAAHRKLRCVVVTPESTVLEEVADFVALPLYDGEIGVAPGHSPMIGRLGYGEMRVRTGGTTRSWFIDGGFVEVADDLVSVLTDRAVAADAIDPQVAAEQLEAARARPANSDELLAQRERAETRARAKLRVARHAK